MASAWEDYPDGVWLVELAALADPALVPQAVAAALGVREEPGRSLTETLATFLAPKRVLVVLDNCEHLLDACAHLADALLRGCSALTLLASSREALGIAGETRWRVPSLAVPDFANVSQEEATHSPAVLLRCDAVRLFVERAQAARPSFALTEQNAAAVAQVCARLDGIPLALELAAARVRVLAVEQIASRLDDRFHLLTGGSRTALERHQTLRAAVDWSYGQLADEEQRLFGRLSVFAGGFTLEAAEAVCAGDGIEEGAVLDLLTRLVDKSLVLADQPLVPPDPYVLPGPPDLPAAHALHAVHALHEWVEQPGPSARPAPPAAPAGLGTRYHVLETLRQYARERLAARGEAAVGAVCRAHARYYVSLLAGADFQGAEEVASLRRLEREHDNLRAALDWWEEYGDDAGAALLLRAVSQWQHWNYNGHLREGAVRVTRALASPAAAAPLPERALALHTAAVLAMWQGSFAAARALAEERFALERRLGGDILAGTWLLAFVDYSAGAVDAARRRLEAWLRESTEPPPSGHFHTLLGRTLLHDDPAAAKARFEEAAAVFRATHGGHATTSVAHGLDWLAGAEFALGDREAARAHWLASLRIRRDLGERTEIAGTLEGLAALAVADGDPRRALRLGAAAAGVCRALGRLQPVPEQERLSRWLAPARAALGARAAAAWEEGAAMAREQAIAYALDADYPTELPLLTRRQREVAAWIACGLTNRQIAARLIVTKGTVDSHVVHILRRLGVRSRAEVAAWVAAHGATAAGAAGAGSGGRGGRQGAA